MLSEFDGVMFQESEVSAGGHAATPPTFDVGAPREWRLSGDNALVPSGGGPAWPSPIAEDTEEGARPADGTAVTPEMGAGGGKGRTPAPSHSTPLSTKQASPRG